MNEKPITIIISDLHVGGGAADPGDDHVYQGRQLVRLLNEGIPEAAGGRVELYINGDFLEFAQTRPDLYTLNSPDFWCSQSESLGKLNFIIEGHADIFAALREFQARGNLVTIGAGNHDVDFFWTDVQNRLREVTGPVQFDLGQDFFTRYAGRLIIGHGHHADPANKFAHWDFPLLNGSDGQHRLEMCPGTLFMARFVNSLEKDYPFADNIIPIQALAGLLWREDRTGLKAAALSLLSLTWDNPGAVLGNDPEPADAQTFASLVRVRYLVNPAFKQRLNELYRQACDPQATPATVAAAVSDTKKLQDFLRRLVLSVPPDEWLDAFDGLNTATLHAGGADGEPAHDHVLGVFRANNYDKFALQREAAKLWRKAGVEIVVFGHTHQPDEVRKAGQAYFNPGSWTRYADVSGLGKLQLADLQNEADFPYQLNYVRVEQTPNGALGAAKVCWEEQDGARFKAH